MKPEEATSGDSDGPRVPRILLLALLGLVAGLSGGIVATTLAPDSLLLTILLIVIVVVGVTLAALRLVGR